MKNLLEQAKKKLYYERVARPSARDRRALRRLRDLHRGETGVILANGPSLRAVDFGLVRPYATIGMNRIYLMYDVMGFRPDYYCIEDRLEAEQECKEINELDGSVMFIPKYLGYCLLKKRNPNIVYTNFQLRYPGYTTDSRFSTDFSQVSYLGFTVTYYALQLAFYMGFSTVVIAGLDHSFQVAKEPGVQAIRGEHGNHFVENYYKPDDLWYSPDMARMERSYAVAERYFRKDGRRVLNATPGSKLDVFPITTLEEALP